MSGASRSTACDRVVLVVQEHVRRVEVHLQVRALQVVERPAEQGGGLLAGLERDRDALLGRELADLAQRVEERLAGRVADLGDEAGVEHQVGQAQLAGAVQGPLEAFESFGPQGRVAEAAGLLDVLAASCSPRRGSRAWPRRG